MKREGIAHINFKEKVQTVAEHSFGVRDRAVIHAETLKVPHMMELGALLHDIGKLCKDFEEYIKGENNITRGEIDHCYAGAKYLCAIADDMGKEFYDVSRIIAHTILSHHGIHDWYTIDGEDYFAKRCSKDERYNEIKTRIEVVISEEEVKRLLILAKEEYVNIRKKINSICRKGPKGKKERAFYLGFLERMLLSILIDSDRTDTADFMSETETETVFSNKEIQAVWEDMNKALKKKLENFSHKKDIISAQRQSISDRCELFAVNEVGICRLIVPTGGSKTLSSLRFAINSCLNHNKEKIIYTAPYMSILEQNGDEIRSISGDENYIEHHSNAFAEIDGKEELAEYELRTEKWDLPVVATTMVQFLNSIFSGKMQSVRRTHRLKNSVIIIDEVQSIPIKCINILNLAINFLSKICNCTIVLCSATQPVFEETEYPLLVDENSSMTGDYSVDFEIFKRTKIIAHITKYDKTYAETADFCYNEYNKNGNMLIIVNTKNSAKAIYELMKDKEYSDNPQIIHLSTNMCAQHRKDKIAEIRKCLKNGTPIICITTQLIEAGVDVSFKCVVRSLAGLDNISQAAGRCNRHGENDMICPVYIVGIKEENVSMLKDIKEAQTVSRYMINKNSEQDFSSPQILSEYYKILFDNRKSEMNYNCSNNETILGLLSTNSRRYTGGVENQYLAQAFKTAGDEFDVIDTESQGVLVPYNEEAKRIINQLEKETDIKRASKLLRTAQKYMVNVYTYALKKMVDEKIIRQTNSIFILEESNYNGQIGLISEPQPKEVMIF